MYVLKQQYLAASVTFKKPAAPREFLIELLKECQSQQGRGEPVRTFSSLSDNPSYPPSSMTAT
jgi:hypothetical protein